MGVGPGLYNATRPAASDLFPRAADPLCLCKRTYGGSDMQGISHRHTWHHHSASVAAHEIHSHTAHASVAARAAPQPRADPQPRGVKRRPAPTRPPSAASTAPESTRSSRCRAPPPSTVH